MLDKGLIFFSFLLSFSLFSQNGFKLEEKGFEQYQIAK